ncbi:gluconokinase [Alkalihalobacterium alkalinitrilicum]|uniref:gluconokinase n=1 Tax=Alkalihalobacterium alkalinitrilicum TaxID=427920 RepID=UPI000994CFAD|nr:FGGY family carbohydrate kinase [Alkalihalobacterium alkalinitrilicum]
MNYAIGLDIGTTSAKAVLFTKEGHVISESEETYPVYHPEPSWVEQNPIKIESSAINALKNIVEKAGVSRTDIRVVGISSAMHSLICMDEDGHAISPSITWADGRSVHQAEKVKSTNNGVDIYLKTGTPIHPMSPLIKLIWMKETNYPPYSKTSKFISIKEYLIKKWFNEYIVDYSVASATGMFNIHTFEWDEHALAITGIQKEQLSTPVAPTHVCEGLAKYVVEVTGLRADIPFVIGASDGPLANLGIGAISPGDVAITVGTSGAIRQMAEKPQTDELQEIFCYGVTKNSWIMGGPTNNGGIVLHWLKEIVGEHHMYLAEQGGLSAYERLTQLAQTVDPGANGLLFLPYLNGERAPYWNANARGSFIGLTLAHQKEHLIRAGMEGVIFSLLTVSEALERLAGPSKNILASGGFARSTLWLQILADIFGQEVQVPKSHQSSAWGAAWIGLVGIGEAKSLTEIKHYIPMEKSYIPNDSNHQVYQTLYPTFKNLYVSLQPHYKNLSDFQRRH